MFSSGEIPYFFERFFTRKESNIDRSVSISFRPTCFRLFVVTSNKSFSCKINSFSSSFSYFLLRIFFSHSLPLLTLWIKCDQQTNNWPSEREKRHVSVVVWIDSMLRREEFIILISFSSMLFRLFAYQLNANKDLLWKHRRTNWDQH